MSSIQGLKAAPPPPPPPKPQPVNPETRETASAERVEAARGQREASESQPTSNGQQVGSRLNVTA